MVDNEKREKGKELKHNRKYFIVENLKDDSLRDSNTLWMKVLVMFTFDVEHFDASSYGDFSKKYSQIMNILIAKLKLNIFMWLNIKTVQTMIVFNLLDIL